MDVKRFIEIVNKAACMYDVRAKDIEIKVCVIDQKGDLHTGDANRCMVRLDDNSESENVSIVIYGQEA